MFYRQAGRSGLRLPLLSLGLWRHFGGALDYAGALELIGAAFDAGITHFDLANNYGTPPGASELLFGDLLRGDLRAHRRDIIIASKAGYRMWPGPAGIGATRKHLVASLDQTLRRLGIDHVDIFYSHRHDPATPLEETAEALCHCVSSGKALYVGISSYPAAETRRLAALMRSGGVPCTLHQPSYSLVNRWAVEDGTFPACEEFGIGIVAFSALAQGVLSGKYENAVPPDSRAADPAAALTHLNTRVTAAVARLATLADRRGQTTAQLALSWVLNNRAVTSAVIGVRGLAQLTENLGALRRLDFDPAELAAIDDILAEARLDLHPNAESWR